MELEKNEQAFKEQAFKEILKEIKPLRDQLERDFEKEILDSSDSAHDLGHIRRVWKLCQRIAQKELKTQAPSKHPFKPRKYAIAQVDYKILLIAAYFHDSVNFPKNHPRRKLASRDSAKKALHYIQRKNLILGDDQKENLFHTIEAHSFSANIKPRTPEACILQDADRLEALGAIGIARVFSVSGALNRPLFNAVDPLAHKRPLDDTSYAVDHFYVKLFKIIETLQTKGAQQIAEKRIDVMKAFLRELEQELT
jgi:uncharacterized protein